MKMMKSMGNIVTAPEHKYFPQGSIKVFLAGGICKCENWQKYIIDNMLPSFLEKNVYLLNPRRDNFVMVEGEETRQIEWEFDMIERCDIFTMYFAGGESDQPICMYELGRNIERMKQKYPDSWARRIIITCDKNYRRLNDVIIQTRLATNGLVKVNVAERVFTYGLDDVALTPTCIVSLVSNVLWGVIDKIKLSLFSSS